MILNLKKSTLFTQDPSTRFAREHGVDVWEEIKRRRVVLDYTDQDLCDYFHIKTGKALHPKALKRWIWRDAIYKKAQIAIAMGAECVVSDYFGENEMEVIRELTKNISSGHENIKVLP